MGYTQSKIDNIDDDVMSQAYFDFIDHNVNPSNINSLIQLTNNHNFDNMTDYYMINCIPTLRRYVVYADDEYYSFPKFLRDLIDYKSLCIMGMLQWLKFYHEILESDNRECYIENALLNDREYYRELFNMTIDNNIYNHLVIHGHFDCLKYCVSKGCICTEEMLELSIKYNHTQIFKYLWRKLSKTIDIVYLSILYESYDIMEFAIKGKYRFNINLCKTLPKCKEYFQTFCEQNMFDFNDKIYDSLTLDKFIHFKGLFKKID
jgi:hypothetical protein